MATIVPFPTPPSSPTPRRSEVTAPTRPAPITCTRWCIDGDGHPDATHPGEQRCRSEVHRVDTTNGGGRGTEPVATGGAGLYLQAEQAAGDQVAFVLGVEVRGTEQWIRLRPAELRVLITAARTLLSQAAAA